MALGTLGIIEFKSFSAALEAADSMIKSSEITFVNRQIVGGAVTLIVSGSIGAVKEAIEIGKEFANRSDNLVNAFIISRPHEDLEILLNNIK